MIDLIKYGKDYNYKMKIFDEPHDDYYSIMLKAASGNHELTPNYRKNLINDHLFMCMLYYKNIPCALFGLYQDKDLPKNVARCFHRYYTIPEWRVKHEFTNKSKKGLKKSTNWNPCLSFYNDYPEYHTDRGIDTLFFTRNVKGRASEKYLTLQMKPYQFKKLEYPLMYKDTLQWFWVQGDSSFTTLLP